MYEKDAHENLRPQVPTHTQIAVRDPLVTPVAGRNDGAGAHVLDTQDNTVPLTSDSELLYTQLSSLTVRILSISISSHCYWARTK